MSKITVFNQKGGVGKTTTVLNLTAALYRHRLNPIAIDLDPQGHLTHIFSPKKIDALNTNFAFFQQKNTLDKLILPWRNIGQIIPAHKSLSKLDAMNAKESGILSRLKTGLNALDQVTKPRNVLIDCCPYVGVLSLNAIFAADLVIIPISSDYLSFQAALNAENTLLALEQVLKRRVERRYLLTSFNTHHRMSYEIQRDCRKCFGDDLLNTVISSNVSIAESPQLHQDIFSYKPNSKGARDYLALCLELQSCGLI